MKQSIIFLFSLFVLLSCKKDKNAVVSVPIAKYLTAERYTHKDGSSKTITYVFDDKLRVAQQIQNGRKTVFSYPNKNKIIEAYYTNEVLSTICEYDLNEKGLIIKGLEKTNEGKITAEKSYEYNNNDQLVKYILSRPGNILKREYVLENGLLVSVKTYTNNVYENRVDYLYESVIPYKGDPLYWLIPGSKAFGNRTKQLPTREKCFLVNGALLYDIVYLWSFDKDGYPSKREIKDQLDPAHIINAEYSYQSF